MKKICFVPIDNRPITYSLTKEIVSINNTEIIMPERRFLGGLTKSANIDEILNSIKNASSFDLIVLSMDTIAYGGLVSSRRGSETFDEIKQRILKLEQILKEKKEQNPNLKVYATSSIMRISNNNINEEEKEYWADYGKAIFNYSYTAHTMGCTPKHSIPDEILEDYLQTRKRNFDINRFYLELLEKGVFDYVVFSKDDTGEFGLNVQEAELLQKEIQEKKLNAIIKTGADEIPLGLLLRGVIGDNVLKIGIQYANPNSIDKISRYEDISVKKCVEAQIMLGIQNAQITNDNSDIILYVNNFDNIQGDLVFQDVINERCGFVLPDKPFVIADINNANGADKGLIDDLFKADLSNFLGYSGYNTSANSIGSALAIGVITYLAKKTGDFNSEAFKKLIAVRLLDELAYQADIRRSVREQGSASGDFSSALKNNLYRFREYENKVKAFLNIKFEAEYSLPWDRSFEIEINLK